ncbi:MAG: hypothetical protein JW881_03560 [Spirochaetales bacterium]|nr:hypothetical protein [Spirochaetales bacterium]
MERTNILKVYTNHNQEENVIIIHPNDGLDIGLMNSSHSIKLSLQLVRDPGPFSSDWMIDGSIMLENGCKTGSIELSTKLWKNFGKPDNLAIVKNNDNIFLMQK